MYKAPNLVILDIRNLVSALELCIGSILGGDQRVDRVEILAPDLRLRQYSTVTFHIPGKFLGESTAHISGELLIVDISVPGEILAQVNISIPSELLARVNILIPGARASRGNNYPNTRRKYSSFFDVPLTSRVHRRVTKICRKIWTMVVQRVARNFELPGPPRHTLS
jgi:hypothetical protein